MSIALLYTYMVPTPVWSVNAPTACIRWRTAGKRNLSCFLSRNLNYILFHFKMFSKMKNQIALPVRQARESRISLWLDRKNCIFSALMEERVSNRQAVLVSQVLASFSILSCSFFIHWLAAVACLCWFTCSVLLCKKGGLR